MPYDMHYIRLKQVTAAFNETSLKIVFDMVPQIRYTFGNTKWI